MSRSRKKVPSYKGTCSWARAQRKASKRAVRRAVKNSLHIGDWDIMPKPGEVGPKWICCHRNGIHDEGYFRRTARYNQEIYEKADKECMYVFEIRDKPYDSWREWTVGEQLQGIDKDNTWSYTAIHKELYTWFPIYNSTPVDPKWSDEEFIRDYYRRK